MRLLILGGTLFLGRALVAAALARGHEITLFNRGKSNPDAYPNLETLIGDRDGDLDALKGRTWDAVVDTCGYVPRVVRQSADLLAEAVDRYVFVSSLSVYADVSRPGLTEAAAVGTLEDERVEEITNETYGPLKALCETAVADALGEAHTLILRPGLIVGPHDRSDRFTYWPCRVAAGGDVLVPGEPKRPIQIIDVRDVAAFTIQAVEQALSGTYNLITTPGALTMGALVEACRRVSGSDATFVWVDEGFLLAQEVGPWMELPLWIPSTREDSAGFFHIDNARAVRAGLTFRPLEETVRATLEWAQTRPVDHEWRAGMQREREEALLAQWRTA